MDPSRAKTLRMQAKSRVTGALVARLNRAARHLNVAQDIERLDSMFEFTIDQAYWAARGSTLAEERSNLSSARTTVAFGSPYTSNTPLVSVLIFTRNRPSLLIERSLLSVQQQTYPNLQIIVVGDGACKETVRAMSGVTDSRVEFVNLPDGPNPVDPPARQLIGGFRAANRALELAQGDFITHVDDDDRMASEKVEVCLGIAMAERAELIWHSVEVVAGKMHRRAENRRPIRGHIGHGNSFYHNYFRKIEWDPDSYREMSGGDWVRFRRILSLWPNAVWSGELLATHFH